MKVGISLGVTLNLGNYSSARAQVTFEDEYLEKELTLPDTIKPPNPLQRLDIANSLADDVYGFVEDKLLEAIKDFVTRLENEGLLGDG